MIKLNYIKNGNEAPKPTPMGKQKFYTLNDSSDFNYKIKLTFSSDKLLIDIEQEDSFPQLYYSSTFSLEEIQKKDKWFRLFDTFDESIDTIDGLFEDKKVNIIKQENNINLIMIHVEKKISDSVFTVEKKKEPEEEEDIMPKLIESHNDLRKRVKILEKSNKQMKEIIDKMISIPVIAQYISKVSKKFLDGIIKNEEDKNLIFSWINPNAEKVSASLIYSAKNDGDSAISFHKLCDNMGPTLVIVETIDGKILGGYTKENWSVDNGFKNNKKNWGGLTNGYKIDEHAFIFSLEKRQKADLIQKIYSIYCNSTSGPTFGGGHDLHICSGCLSSKGSYTRPHSYKYKNKDDEANIQNAASFGLPNNSWNFNLNNNNNFQCKEVEVYAITEN